MTVNVLCNLFFISILIDIVNTAFTWRICDPVRDNWYSRFLLSRSWIKRRQPCGLVFVCYRSGTGTSEMFGQWSVFIFTAFNVTLILLWKITTALFLSSGRLSKVKWRCLQPVLVGIWLQFTGTKEETCCRCLWVCQSRIQPNAMHCTDQRAAL